MATTPGFLRGRNVKTLIQVGTSSVTVRLKSIAVDEEGDEGYDGVNGENRGRPWKETDGFNVGFEAYTEADNALIASAISQITNHDANNAPLVTEVGIILYGNDGTRKAYKLSDNVTPRMFKLNAGGRKEAVMLPYGFRAQNFSQVQAA